MGSKKYLTNFTEFSALNEGKNVNAKNTISFQRGGKISLHNNKMVNHLGNYSSQIKDNYVQKSEMWALVGFNDVLMNGNPYVLLSGFDGKGDAAEEGRELLFVSTDEKEVQKKFKSGASGTGFASVAWGKVEWSKFADDSINVIASDINIATLGI